MSNGYKVYWADLHIHSALSPCADNTMTPMAIVKQAQRKGLSIIALTDHNSVLNCPAICNYSSDELMIIPGMELQTREEVHLVCLFGGLAEAFAWYDLVSCNLIPKPNQVEYFGNQYIFDNSGRICGEEPNLLLISTKLSFEQVFQEIVRFDGFAMPAHIDRPSFSVISNLGFLPPSFSQKTVEISYLTNETEFKSKYSQFSGFQLIQSSDAHRLHEIGHGKTPFTLPELSWKALWDKLN